MTKKNRTDCGFTIRILIPNVITFIRVNNMTSDRSVRSLHYPRACQRLGLIFNRGLNSYQLIASAPEDFEIEDKTYHRVFQNQMFFFITED